jgi:hypothetical protein
LSEQHIPSDPRPTLLTDKAGPSRQVSLLDFNIPGNPRTSESNSANSQFHQFASQLHQHKTCDQCIIPDDDPARPISGDVEDEEGGYFDYMGEGEGDEDDGGEDEDDGDEDVGSASKKPAKPLPPAVKDAYQKALEFLKQTSGPKSKPVERDDILRLRERADNPMEVNLG